MPVPLFTHPDCVRHDPGSDHPETPARLRVLVERARGSPAAKVVESKPASREPLLAVHPDA
jgi:acetoin utilization deacetylase AcuC-like enzyme